MADAMPVTIVPSVLPMTRFRRFRGLLQNTVAHHPIVGLHVGDDGAKTRIVLDRLECRHTVEPLEHIEIPQQAISLQIRRAQLVDRGVASTEAREYLRADHLARGRVVAVFRRGMRSEQGFEQARCIVGAALADEQVAGEQRRFRLRVASRRAT